MVDFLSLKKDAFGLEITDVNVRIMKLARVGGRLAVVATGCLALEKDIVKDGLVLNEKKLADAIKELVLRVSTGKKLPRFVVVSLPEDKAFLQVIAMPKLNDQELRAAVVFEAENYIPLPLEKVYLDFEVVPSVLENNSRHEVLVVALPKETVDSRLRAIDMAGLTPTVMCLESQAVVVALTDEINLKSPTMIIHIGDAQSGIIIYSRNSIRFTFSIPISNCYFLQKICDSVGVLMSQAELLKVQCGIEEFVRATVANQPMDDATDDKRKIFEALIPGLVDFVQQIQKCVGYYQTHEADVQTGKIFFDKVLICGSGANLKGLDEFLSLKLATPVERVILPTTTDGDAVVAGLAIRALGVKSGGDKYVSPIVALPSKKNLHLRIKIK